jgi:hypothetical protein
VNPEEARMLVAKVIQESGMGRAQIARDSDLSVAALNAWTAKGRAARMPQPESVAKLAAGLRSRAAKLEALAAELEGEAGEGES